VGGSVSSTTVVPRLYRDAAGLYTIDYPGDNDSKDFSEVTARILPITSVFVLLTKFSDGPEPVQRMMEPIIRQSHQPPVLVCVNQADLFATDFIHNRSASENLHAMYMHYKEELAKFKYTFLAQTKVSHVSHVWLTALDPRGGLLQQCFRSMSMRPLYALGVKGMEHLRLWLAASAGVDGTDVCPKVSATLMRPGFSIQNGGPHSLLASRLLNSARRSCEVPLFLNVAFNDANPPPSITRAMIDNATAAMAANDCAASMQLVLKPIRSWLGNEEKEVTPDYRAKIFEPLVSELPRQTTSVQDVIDQPFLPDLFVSDYLLRVPAPSP